MRWIKYALFALGGIGVFFLLMIAVVMVTFDNNDYRRLAVRAVKHLTGYNMTIDGPFSLQLSMQPSLSAEMIRFTPEPGKPVPPVKNIGKFGIQVALRPLLAGTLVVKILRVDDVIMAVTIGGDSEPKDPSGYGRKLPRGLNMPVLESVRLRNLYLDVIDAAADRTIDVRLQDFTIDDDRNGGPLFVKGNGTISGTEFNLDGRLGALDALFSGTEPYPVDLSFHTGGLRVSASGTIKKFLRGKGLALHLAGETGDLSTALKLLKIEAPPLGVLTFQATVTRDLAAPRVSDLSVNLWGDPRLDLAIDGGIDNAATGEGTDIRFSGSCRSAEVLAWLLDENAAELGQIRVVGEVQDAEGALAVEKLNLVIGDEEKAALTVTGRFLVAGNPVQFAVSEADLEAVSAQGLTVAATGGVSRIRPRGKTPLAGVDVSLSATAPIWAALPGAAGLELPNVGPLQIKAVATDGSGRLDVDSFELVGGTDDRALLALQGRISGIGSIEGMALQATVETTSQPWVSQYLNRPQATDVPLTGAISITGNVDGVRIDEARFETTGTGRLSAVALGYVHHLAASPALDLQLKISAPDPSTLGPMFGVSLPALAPLTIDGRVESNAQRIDFSGTTRLGDTAIQSTVGATFSHPRPRIVARFSATRIGLENIGIFPAAPSVSPEATTAAQPHNSTPLFGDSPLNFEALKGYDVDFTLDAAELAGRNVGIRDLNLDIKLENGRLHMHPASLVYRAGFTEFDFTVDASGAVPEFELKITGEDIDIEEVLANAHEPLVLGGDLNVFVHLRSSGRSYREIATNLVGEVSLALEDGQIRRVINFLSADAFNLLLTVADRRQATDLNCLVGKIQFQEGVGGIDFFVMDTPRIKATAAGSVDLAAETVDVGIYPRVKRRLIRGEQSAVRIYGPLNQPSVSAWPLSEVAQLFGQVLISPVTLAERTLGSLWYVISKDAEASPCLR